MGTRPPSREVRGLLAFAASIAATLILLSAGAFGALPFRRATVAVALTLAALALILAALTLTALTLAALALLTALTLAALALPWRRIP